MDMIILGITLVITLGAQVYINSWYSRTKKMPSSKSMTGKEVARKILDANGLKKVKVEEQPGTLTDHYDPRNKVVRLSTDIYNNKSLASISVASHECGHAIQDKDNYFFLRLRSSIVPLVNIASKLGYVAIMIGLIMGSLGFFRVGIALEFVILAFQLITLPVEFNASSRALKNASSRALKQIKELGIVVADEHRYCRKMLTSAALTYVASVATAVLEIFRLILIARDR